MLGIVIDIWEKSNFWGAFGSQKGAKNFKSPPPYGRVNTGLYFSFFLQFIIQIKLTIFIVVNDEHQIKVLNVFCSFFATIKIGINFVTKLIIHNFFLKTFADRKIKLIKLHPHGRNITTKIAKWNQSCRRQVTFIQSLKQRFMFFQIEVVLTEL